MQQGGGFQINPGSLNMPVVLPLPDLPGLTTKGRMGATVRTPDATLIEQLGLPKIRTS